MKHILLKPSDILVHLFFPYQHLRKEGAYTNQTQRVEFNNYLTWVYSAAVSLPRKNETRLCAIVAQPTQAVRDERFEFATACIESKQDLLKIDAVKARRLFGLFRRVVTLLDNHTRGKYYLVDNEIEAIALALTRDEIPSYILESDSDITELKQMKKDGRASPLLEGIPNTIPRLLYCNVPPKRFEGRSNEGFEYQHLRSTLGIRPAWKCLGITAQEPHLHLPLPLDVAVRRLHLPKHIRELERKF